MKHGKEVTPPGYEDVVLALKKKAGIDNPWAIAWAMHNKGESVKGKTEAEIMKIAEKYIKEALKDEKIKPEDKETNAMSSNAQLTKVKQVKESKANYNFSAHFLEAEVNENLREVPVIIIQEGMGNSRDKHFYTKEALQKSYRRFDGAQCYADHPTRTEEADRPERSVRDIIGYYMNPQSIDFNGKTAIKATLKIAEGDSYNWAWDLIKEAINFQKLYPDKDLVGVSINADGVTHPGEGEDEDIIHYVDEITEVFSSDVVTKAGAGGRIGAGLKESVKQYLEAKGKNLKEAGAIMKKALKKMASEMEALKAKKEAGEVDDKAYGTAMDEIVAQLNKLADEAPETEDEGEGEKKEGEGEGEKKEEEGEAPPADDKKDEKDEKVKEALRDENLMLKTKIKLMESKELVGRLLKESKLPAGTYDDLKEVLIGKDEKYCKKLIEARREFISNMLKAKVVGNGEVIVESGKKESTAFDGLPKKQSDK